MVPLTSIPSQHNSSPVFFYLISPPLFSIFVYTCGDCFLGTYTLAFLFPYYGAQTWLSSSLLCPCVAAHILLTPTATLTSFPSCISLLSLLSPPSLLTPFDYSPLPALTIIPLPLVINTAVRGFVCVTFRISAITFP